MNYKQLTKISLNLLHSKHSIEACLLKEESDSDINLLGYIHYIDLYLTNIIDCYKSIKNEIEILHFKTKDVPEWWGDDVIDLKEDLIHISNDLPLVIPKLVKEYIERSVSIITFFIIFIHLSIFIIYNKSILYFCIRFCIVWITSICKTNQIISFSFFFY